MRVLCPFFPVNHLNPCLICRKGDWCRRSADGAHECHRIQEAEVNGLRFIATTPEGYSVYRHPNERAGDHDQAEVAVNRKSPSKSEADFALANSSFREAISKEQKAALASQLGVSVEAIDSVEVGIVNEEYLRRFGASGHGWTSVFPKFTYSFPERDGSGAIVGFSLRAADGRKGAPSGKVGARRGLIIPSTLPNRPDPVLLVEGATDVAACDTMGLAAVGRPSNTAGAAQIASLLAQRKVLVIGENDIDPAGNSPGRRGAKAISQSLAAAWNHLVSWTLPPGGSKDVREYLQRLVSDGLDLSDQHACHQAGKQLLDALLASTHEAEPPEPKPDSEKERFGPRDVVIQLCKDANDHFFHNNEDRAFVYVREGGLNRTLAVNSRAYMQLFARRYYEKTRCGLPAGTKSEVITTLEGIAVYEGPEEETFLRVGEHVGRVVLDLCDAKGRVVIVDKDGWKVHSESPIRLLRRPGMLPLPVPAQGGSIADLRPLINIRDENDFILLCAFLLNCFNPRGPYFVLLVNGESGSAKSTLCRMIRSLIDPNKAPLRGEARDERDLAISANNAWMIGLDNLSHISERMSNALCRLATGGGFATRELYSDAEEIIFDAKRPIMINGIGEVADRSDLIDRSIRLNLLTIDERNRRTEMSLQASFEEKKPQLLGAFLSAVSSALRHQDNVKFENLPRMADAVTWVVAAEKACPWKRGGFVAAMNEHRRVADEFIVDTNLLARAVLGQLSQTNTVVGTATELLNIFSNNQPKSTLAQREWPKSAAALGTRLREIAPNLRRLGIEVDFGRSGARREIQITRIAGPTDSPSSLSLPSSADEKPYSAQIESDLQIQNHDSDPPNHDGEADTTGDKLIDDQATNPIRDSDDSNDGMFSGETPPPPVNAWWPDPR